MRGAFGRVVRKVAEPLVLGVLVLGAAGASSAAAPVMTSSTSISTSNVAEAPQQVQQAEPGTEAEQAEVDTLLSQMSVEDKVGQVFMLGFPGSDATAARPMLTELRAGGIVLTSNVSDASSAETLTSGLQTMANADGLLPLLISVNHEGGSVQPITGGMTSFGPQFELGKVQPADVAVAAACRRGDVHGQELAEIGINMNLAPDLDVWDNPANTVIGDRSFSSDPSTAAMLGAAYIEGLQRHGVLAVGKHFPGHGSSTDDSHETLPIVMHDRAWLDSHELVPFEAAINASVAAIMVGHLSFPLIDPVADRPSSLSPVFVSGMLRTDLGFDGLVVTDDLGQMRAVTAGYTPGDAAIQSLQAGSDVLLVVGPLQTERQMVRAVIGGVGSSISMDQLDAAVRRVLTAKIQAGLLPGSAPSLSPTTPSCS